MRLGGVGGTPCLVNHEAVGQDPVFCGACGMFYLPWGLNAGPNRVLQPAH